MYSKTIEVLKKYNDGSWKNKEDIEGTLKCILDGLTIQYQNPEPMHVEDGMECHQDIFHHDPYRDQNDLYDRMDGD